MPTLDAFQHDVLDFIDAAGGRAIYGDPMGARKTGTTLSYLERLSSRALIVAPSSVHGHWAREAARFFPEAEVFIGTGAKDKRHAAIERVTFNNVAPTLFITTYESMKQDEARLIGAKFSSVVFDEAHRLKGRRTGVALTANAVTKKPPHLLLLTGTPVLNGAEELWQYLHMLAPKAYPAYWKWAEAHFKVEIVHFRGNRYPTRIVHGFKPGHEHIVRAQLAPFLIQREIAELFPGAAWVEEAEHTILEIELSPAERKLYNRLIEHQWGKLGETTISVENPLALSTRLQQLSSEWGNLDPGAPDGTKVVAATDRLVDLTARGPVVVFASYKETCDRLVRKLIGKGISAAAWHGDVPLPIRENLIEAWQDEKVDVIVGTLASLGEGVDGLQYRCNQMLFIDRHWTAVRNDQAIGRLRRSGQQHRVFVEHLYAPATIDATVLDACLTKTNVVNVLKDRPLVDVIYGRGLTLDNDGGS